MKNFKRVLALVLSVLLICGTVAVAFAAESVTPESEDNNTFANATTISYPTYGATGNLSSTGDVDYFKFTQAKKSSVQLVFTHNIKSSTDSQFYTVAVYSAADAEKVIKTVNVLDSDTTTKLDLGVLEAGDYYISVAEGKGGRDSADYKIVIQNVADKYSYEVEPNNDKTTATPLKTTSKTSIDDNLYVGTISSATDDVDYYSFSTSKGYISLNLVNGSYLSSGAANSNFKFEVLQYTNAIKPTLEKICTLTLSADDTTTENSKQEHFISSPYIGVDAGTYFIKVSGSTGTYGIGVFAVANSSMESERNNEKAYADVITNGSALLGSTSASDDIDCFKITTTTKESSTIKVAKFNTKEETLEGSWKVTVYKEGSGENFGDEVISKTVTASSAAEISLADKAAGTYYVVITPSSDNNGVLYQISAEKATPSSSSTSTDSSGNSWDNLWSTIKKMDWGAWWNKNFSFLSKIDWQTTISQLLKGSLGTILKYFLSNLTA